MPCGVVDLISTQRLYYEDPYLREFTARVVGRTEWQGRTALLLDRTAFYPTGGGQPCDTGRLNHVSVVDTVSHDGTILHVVAEDLADDAVTGFVDWPRRFDHMQQHTGQHVLSQAFTQVIGADTLSFHLGESLSTIDVGGVHQEYSVLRRIEDAANRLVDEAVPVITSFHDAASLADLPLRKPPKVTQLIRVVQVEAYDWSACGGTHVRSCAEIGLIKIVGTERRGGETRVSFRCGARARHDYARVQALVQRLGARFSTSEDELSAAVDRLFDEGQALRKEFAQLEAAWVESTAGGLAASALPLGSALGISLSVDWPVERAKRVAQALRSRPGLIILLGISGERPQLIFTRSDDVSYDVGSLLRRAAAAADGRGGGRADWAQGGVPTAIGLERALAHAAEELRSS